MRRVSVVGCSGAGKSTLAWALAERLSCPHVELDAIFHQPNWAPLPIEAFRARVADVVSGESWVADGNYFTKVGELVWSRADTVVWLDLPRAQVTRAILGRSLRRLRRGEELWNGNRERWRNLVDPRPETNVVLWSWLSHGRLRRRYEPLMVDPRWRHIEFVRLRSRAAAETWLEGATRA